MWQSMNTRLYGQSARHLHGLRAVSGDVDAAALALEQMHRDYLVHRVVLADEHADQVGRRRCADLGRTGGAAAISPGAAAESAASGTLTGIVNQNVEPTPGVLSTRSSRP